MSAIAGIIQFDGRPVDRATLERMQTVLTPYGRDAQNHVHQGSAAFLRTLLRTTPEDSLDHQPLVHAESGTTLLFDGRIDNRDELAQALGLSAADTALLADSDLVLRACLRWDTGAVECLLGDFALACWQAPRRRLWITRDPLGYRPLFWHQQAGFFAFATMPKGLFAISGISKALNEERLHDFLCLLPMVGPESFFKGIYRVEPGQVVVLEGGKIASHRYHCFDPNRELKLSSDDEYVEAFREQLDRAVACRLRAIGPIASHLSSGFDSSTITAVAAQQLAAQGKRLLAYTAVPRDGFKGPVPRGRHADEQPGASALAARFPNIDHILIRSGGISSLDLLAEDVACLDRAPLNPCNMVWINGIELDAERRGVKVLLSAAMGNYTISYEGMHRLPNLIGRGLWVSWWRQAFAFKRTHPHWNWRYLLIRSLEPHLPKSLWLALEKRRGKERRLTDYSAINPEFIARMQTKQRAKKLGWDLTYRPWANGRHMRIAGFGMLDYAEHNAAANTRGMETRDPTSHLPLIEFCLSLPDRQYLHDGQTRWLLHRLVGDMLPHEILHSSTRGYQAADWYERIGESLPLVSEALRDMIAQGRVSQYLDLDALLDSLTNWPSTGWEKDNVNWTYRYKLLRGLSAGAFVCHIEDNNR